MDDIDDKLEVLESALARQLSAWQSNHIGSWQSLKHNNSLIKGGLNPPPHMPQTSELRNQAKRNTLVRCQACSITINSSSNTSDRGGWTTFINTAYIIVCVTSEGPITPCPTICSVQYNNQSVCELCLNSQSTIGLGFNQSINKLGFSDQSWLR